MIKLTDMGIQMVKGPDGKRYRAYVTLLEYKCPECGRVLGAHSSVDEMLASLGGDRSAFRAAEDRAFQRALEEEMRRHRETHGRKT